MKRSFRTRAVVALVGGVVLNVLVAWGLLVLGANGVLPGTTTRLLATDEGALRWPERAMDGLPEPDSGRRSNYPGRDILSISATRTEFNAVDPSQSSFEFASYSTTKLGWPFRCLSSELHLHSRVVSQHPAVADLRPTRVDIGGWRSGFRFPAEEITVAGVTLTPLYFPRRPIPLGFAANSLLYALLLGGVLFGVPAWRDRRRRTRGLCVACGYDMGGVDTCPECGGAPS